jgi:hypothetical protein
VLLGVISKLNKASESNKLKSANTPAKDPAMNEINLFYNCQKSIEKIFMAVTWLKVLFFL